MSNDVQQYSSISGEVAKNLWGRTDFQKYDSGWARAQNWLVDYRGGLFSRFGFEFADIIEWTEGEDIKLIPFQYSPDTANTYVCVFTNDKVRFVQDGAYVLEAAKTVTSLTNDSGSRVQFTSNAHGFSNGDWVKLSGFITNSSFNTRTAEVANAATNTFTLIDPITGNAILVASVTTEAGSVSRIYTIASPYGEEDLADLRAKQIRDYVRLTHPNYPIKNLIRAGATSWSIANETIGSGITQVTGVTLGSTSSGTNYSYIYAVTAVDANGNEGPYGICAAINTEDLETAAARVAIYWTAKPGTLYYNIYRSRRIFNASGGSTYTDSELGYIGTSVGTRFSDKGITPDYTKQPPIAYNPFANGAIRYVDVTTVGSGYTHNTSVITWPAGGSGAVGILVVQCDGSSPIYGLKVLDGGSGYTGTTITASVGSGAVMTAVLSAASGNNPRCCELFQQRCLYGGTDENPLRLFGSKPGLLSNFDYTDIGADNDGYEFDLDAAQIAPIRHLVNVNGGLLVFNQIGVWLVYGANEATVTAANAKADPQNAVGASLVPPAFLDNYVVYVSDAGQEIRILRYAQENNGFIGQNVSMIANHLFGSNNSIKALTYGSTPYKVLFAVQEDGTLVAVTVDIENNVYAATPNITKGYFRHCLAIDEDQESRLYTAVEREINGNRVLYLERSISDKQRKLALENSFCLDAALEYTWTAPSGRLVPSSLTGAVTFTVRGATPFTAGDVGKILRCGSGKAVITGYTSSSVITGTWQRNLVETYPETSNPAEFLSGNWWLDDPISSVTGLWHLEGETVSMLVDGEVVTGRTVTNGAVSVVNAANDDTSRIVIGLPFTCIAQTLPITATDLPVEGRRKRIIGTAMRQLQSNGLKIGPALTKLKPVAVRSQRLFGTADVLNNYITYEPIASDWSEDNQIFFVQDSPRPASILNFIRDVEIGDDKQ